MGSYRSDQPSGSSVGADDSVAPLTWVNWTAPVEHTRGDHPRGRGAAVGAAEAAASIAAGGTKGVVDSAVAAAASAIGLTETMRALVAIAGSRTALELAASGLRATRERW